MFGLHIIRMAVQAGPSSLLLSLLHYYYQHHQLTSLLCNSLKTWCMCWWSYSYVSLLVLRNSRLAAVSFLLTFTWEYPFSCAADMYATFRGSSCAARYFVWSQRFKLDCLCSARKSRDHFTCVLQRRERELRAKGLLYVGSGVSGGEDGARFGPSLMPGGSSDAWYHFASLGFDQPLLSLLLCLVVQLPFFQLQPASSFLFLMFFVLIITITSVIVTNTFIRRHHMAEVTTRAPKKVVVCSRWCPAVGLSVLRLFLF